VVVLSLGESICPHDAPGYLISRLIFTDMSQRVEVGAERRDRVEGETVARGKLLVNQHYLLNNLSLDSFGVFATGGFGEDGPNIATKKNKKQKHKNIKKQNTKKGIQQKNKTKTKQKKKKNRDLAWTRLGLEIGFFTFSLSSLRSQLYGLDGFFVFHLHFSLYSLSDTAWTWTWTWTLDSECIVSNCVRHLYLLRIVFLTFAVEDVTSPLYIPVLIVLSSFYSKPTF
jgi:hypothetical protein